MLTIAMPAQAVTRPGSPACPPAMADGGIPRANEPMAMGMLVSADQRGSELKEMEHLKGRCMCDA